MENKNKYYQPEIEEFHVGFEYEIKISSEFTKETFNQFEERAYRQIYDFLILKQVRVKHLDREDIEIEGWVKNISIENYWRLYNFVLRLKDSTLSIYIYDEYWTDKVVFDGEVKNISELRIIMKMLGIKK